MEILLEKIRLYGYHGLHTGEEILGGEFEVNLTVHYSPVELPVQNLSDTVDYTALYELVKTRMQKPALPFSGFSATALSAYCFISLR